MPFIRKKTNDNNKYEKPNKISVAIYLWVCAFATIIKARSQLQILKKSPHNCQA
jgi:hypothetical protein